MRKTLKWLLNMTSWQLTETIPKRESIIGGAFTFSAGDIFPIIPLTLRQVGDTTLTPLIHRTKVGGLVFRN
jgi:hypothetical protein